VGEQALELRYGLNPDQVPARVEAVGGAPLPFTVLGGRPGYINLLDALNGWQLVSEMRNRFGLPAAASLKHVTPAGAALGLPLSPELAEACRVPASGLSPLACAYVRARGADRMASFGDFAAFSDPVDAAAAEVLGREVSDGVVAPGYEPAALERLRRKKGGAYLILQMDPAWSPPPMERREVFGVAFQQPRSTRPVEVGTPVTRRREVSAEAGRDMVLAAIVLRYTPSNSVALAWDGQAIGVGAGQQSRIHCTRLACGKAETWWLRQHPETRGLPLPAGLSRPARDNAIDAWLSGEDLPGAAALAPEARAAWLGKLHGVALASDGFIPFRDNIDRAARTGVGYVWQPGGSERDSEVVAAADEHGMVMCLSGLRLFQH
jgi:phosphoribosylaminoimidazolecarboxamide formyltransferase/IMP cyclohydrolase